MSVTPPDKLPRVRRDEGEVAVDRSRLFPQTPSQLADWTDQYFSRTRQVVERFGDKRVTYCVFMRRPVLFAPALMLGLVGWHQGRAARSGLYGGNLFCRR